MDTSLSELLDLSIAHEINISRLYTLFHELFEEDEDFWWQLSIEERSHAALLRNEKAAHKHAETVPENLLTNDLDALKSSNAKLESLIDDYTANPLPGIHEQKILLSFRRTVQAAQPGGQGPC